MVVLHSYNLIRTLVQAVQLARAYWEQREQWEHWNIRAKEQNSIVHLLTCSQCSTIRLIKLGHGTIDANGTKTKNHVDGFLDMWR